MATDYIKNAIENLEKQRAKILERIDYFKSKEEAARTNLELKIKELEFIDKQIETLQPKGQVKITGTLAEA